MLFEIRESTPEVSTPWVGVRDLFLTGKIREARAMSLEVTKGSPPQTANDYILLIEIARACSEVKRALALSRLANRHFPDDMLVPLLHARSLLTRGRYWPAIQFLMEREPQEEGLHRTLWATILADVYGDGGFETSGHEWLERCANMPHADLALPLYNRACATQGMRLWDQAIALTTQCSEIAPGWIRARAFHINCLLSAGRIAEARAEIAAAKAMGFEDATLDSTDAMVSFSLGEFERAESLFRDLLEHWPKADFVNYIRRSLCVLLVELGRPEEAREITKGDEEKLALPKLPDEVTGKHQFIPLPLVAQNTNECVPTSVAMAIWPHGKQVDPSQMYKEMHGRDGVPLWRMREWAGQNGCLVVPVKLSEDAVKSLLDQNILLIGVLEGAFNSHVEVICGYHEDLDGVYVRDPGHWVPIVYPTKMAFDRYELHGGLLAVIPHGHSALAEAEQYTSEECQSLIDLAQAVFHMEREAAEKASSQIADDSVVSFMRDNIGYAFVVSPPKYSERMAKLAQEEDANPVARFRAMLNMGSDEAQDVLDQLLKKDGGRLGTHVRRYMELLKHMHDGRWTEANRLADMLLVSGGSIAQMWDLKSDILSELGDHDGCTVALERAMDLEPRRLSLKKKSLDRRANELTYSDYLAEFEDLWKNDPDDKRLLWGFALALQDGPDGMRHEEAMREYLQAYPRDPSAYSQLLYWYRMQRRPDLVDQTLDTACELLPDVFSKEEDEADGKKPAEDAAGNDREEQDKEEKEKEKDAQPEPLPEGHNELIDVAFNPDDQRRTEALEKLAAIESAKRLTWYERARLVSCRLLVGKEAESLTMEAATALLPAEPPGANHWFADVVADIVSNYSPPLPVPRAVNEWVERVVPNYQNYVELWFNRVLLYEKSQELERALSELEQLLSRYPAYSSALYRMGVVKRRQHDFSSAEHFLKEALKVNPGLPGAIEVLRSVYEDIDNSAAALDCVRKQRRKFPYDPSFLKDEVVMSVDVESAEKAHAVLQQVTDEFPSRRLAILRGRVELRDGQLEAVANLLNELVVDDSEQDEDLLEDYLQLKLGFALRQDDDQGVIETCDMGLRRWPDWTRLKEISAERIAKTDRPEARKRLSEVLKEGYPEPQTAWQYLQVVDSDPSSAAKAVVLDAELDRQQALAELFGRVMSEMEYVRWNEAYLKWAIQKFPDSFVSSYRLASHYNMAHQSEEATEIAQRLYDEEPDNPDVVGLLGRCLLEIRPKDALPHLEKACELNRSVEGLFDLARCYHSLDRLAEAKKTHQEIMEQNPHHGASWTNLYILGAQPHELWSYIESILKIGGGLEDEYCLVAMVFVAIKVGKPLPQDWIHVAARRMQILGTHPGYQDETSRLRKAILSWQALRNDRVPDLTLDNGGFFERLSARFLWPGRKWIPQP